MASTADARSPYAMAFIASIGTVGATCPSANALDGTYRSPCTRKSGASAAGVGSAFNAGHTYHFATRPTSTRENVNCTPISVVGLIADPFARGASVLVHLARSHVNASCRSTNHFVGKTAGPSTASVPALENPAGMRNANRRTPAAPYRGMMWASRHSMIPGPNV